MRSSTWLRSGSRGECVIANIMPPRSKTKKIPPPNKSAKKTLPPNKSAKAPRKDPPARSQNPVVGTKRKVPNRKTFLNQNGQRKPVIPKYALWQRPTFQTSSAQSPTPTIAKGQPKWGPADAHCEVATEPVRMTHPVLTLNQVLKRKTRSTRMLVCVIAQLVVHYTNIALYNIVCNMQKEKTRVRLLFLLEMDRYQYRYRYRCR